MPRKIEVVVLASGNGSNFQALFDASKKPGYPVKITALITNVTECYARYRARNGDVKDICIPNKYQKNRETWERLILFNVQYYNPDIICLAGFMKILSPEFFKSWTKPILNIHPSLLPDFKGINAIEQALEAGVKQTGCTVHYVIPELDAGPIIGQKKVKITKQDTLETISAKIHKQEHKLYPAMLKKIANELINV